MTNRSKGSRYSGSTGSIGRMLALSLTGTIGLTSASGAVAQTQDPAAGSRSAAQGQTETAPTADGSVADPDETGEILVTARLRTESLQTVPISAQVIGPQRLAQQNITSLVALGSVSPSLRVQSSGRSNVLYIRGTGSGESQSFDQSVSTFIDGIYHGRSRYTEAAFLDLDHLEILKGPQSTFFGNNAIAGAFNLVTEKPGKEFSGWGRALISPTSGESGGQYAMEGAVTVPFSDALGLRVAASMTGQNGNLRNVVTGRDGPQINTTAFRATLRYNPDDALDITLKGEIGQSENDGGLILRQVECPPRPPATASGFCAVNLAAGAPTGLEGREYVQNEGNRTDLKTFETVLTVNYRAGDNTLTSITGYSGYEYALDLDNDGTASTLLNVQAGERQRQFSQELRLTSPTGRTIEYLAGLYFQSDTLRLPQAVTYYFLSPTINAAPTFAPIRPFLPLGQKIDVDQDTKTYSAFGSITWNVSEALKLTAGLRGSITERDFDWSLFFAQATQTYGGLVPLPPAAAAAAGALRLGTAGSVSLKRNDKALLPSLTAQYSINPGVMAYASYSRGHKAGGFSAAELSATPQNYPFGPEKVNAYEIGLKSKLLDRVLTLNLAAFRNDFSDLQVVIQGQQGNALINFVRNAARSRSQGLEVEANWTPGDIFRLVVAGTYLDSEYRSYANAGPTSAQQLAGAVSQDLSGRPTLFAPRWSGTVTGTARLPVTDDLRLTTEAIGIVSSRFQTLSTLDPLAEQPGYIRLDGRISLDSEGGRWGFDIIGKNLTNRIVRTLTGPQPTSLGSFFQNRQPLASIAFQARYRF